MTFKIILKLALTALSRFTVPFGHIRHFMSRKLEALADSKIELLHFYDSIKECKLFINERQIYFLNLAKLIAGKS